MLDAHLSAQCYNSWELSAPRRLSSPDLLVPHLALSGCIRCQTFKVAEDEPHMLHVAAARRVGRVIPLTSSEM